jgi:trans-aconitate methyltransferase
MDFYENKKNVGQYIEFTPSHDGALLVDLLVNHLPASATVLELGMGPGKDFDKLSKHFSVTGSDFSTTFLELYRLRNDSADLLHLDARTLDTERTFDAIFSNKALIHLSREDLRTSFLRQSDVLNAGGLVLHSFWHGAGEANFDGLRLVYQDEHELAGMLEDAFDIIDVGRHAKMAEDDSIYVLARKRSAG